MPGCQVLGLDGLVVSLPCGGDLLPSLSILSECPAEFILGTQRVSSSGCSPTQSVRQSLVLDDRSGGWGRRGEVGAFEVGGSEGGQVVANRSTQLSNGFLDLGGIVIRLRFIDFGDPGERCVNQGAVNKGKGMISLEKSEMGQAQSIDAALEILILCELNKFIRNLIGLETETRFTLGKFSDLFSRYLAETFPGGLNGRVEALGELGGRFAKFESSKRRLEFVPAFHSCRVVG